MKWNPLKLYFFNPGSTISRAALAYTPPTPSSPQVPVAIPEYVWELCLGPTRDIIKIINKFQAEELLYIEMVDSES